MNLTNTLFLAAVLCLSLSGCTSPFYTYTSERISEIPTQPHANDVGLFFTGEVPEEEYVKIAALETSGEAQTTYAELIKNLKLKAQKHGADAILVQNKESISDVSSSGISRAVSTTTTSELHGIAIKYKKNLNLAQMPKLQQIHVYNAESKEFEPLLNLQLNYGGAIESQEKLHPEAARFYHNYIRPYATHHLVYEQGAGWEYQEQGGLITGRQLTIDGSIQKKVKIAYTPKNQISKILIEEPPIKKEHIDFEYDADGNLVARYIYRENRLLLLERYTYSASGQIDQVKAYTSTKAGDTPLLQSTFAYYTKDEVK